MKTKWIICCLAAVAMTSSVFAQTDLVGNWTYQLWTFDSDKNPAAPEVYDNPYGTPTAVITVKDPACGADPGWYESFLGRSGVWAAEFTTATLTIQNNPVTTANSYKEIWVKMGFRTEVVASTVLVANIPNLIVETIEYSVTPTRTQDGYLDGWYELNIHWKIWPNPLEETIFLSVKDSGADIDYIEVKTVCVPEPASLCLLGLGALSIFRKR